MTSFNLVKAIANILESCDCPVGQFPEAAAMLIDAMVIDRDTVRELIVAMDPKHREEFIVHVSSMEEEFDVPEE